MRPPVKSPELDLAVSLALQLLSPSKRFENPRAVASFNAREGLRALGTLDKLARLSLPISAPTPSPQAATPPPADSARGAAPARPAALPVNYQSARQEYKAALEDDSVIRALLELHQQARAPRSSLKSRPLAGFGASPPPQVRTAELKNPFQARGTSSVYRSPEPAAPRRKPRA